MIRPRAVILAEQLYFASILVLVAIIAGTWRETVAGAGATLAGAVSVGIIAVMVVLLVLTTRRASRVALKFLAVLTALNAIGVLIQLANGVLASGTVGVLTIVQLVLTIIPVVLLYSPSARPWFSANDDEGYEA